MSDKHTNIGSFVLNKLSLFHRMGEGTVESEIDLVLSYQQISIFESIYDHTMSGSIAFVDTNNLQDILPLYGKERIEIEFYTAGNKNNPILYKGLVYKISEKHRITDHSEGYIIYFMSEEAFNSQIQFVQRGYNDIISNIVNKLYRRIVGEQNKTLETVSTQGRDNYVFGSVKPLQAVSMLSKKAYSNLNEVGYVFYEDNLQFNFKPLQALYKQEPITEYRSRNKGVYNDVTQRAQESHTTIQDFKILEENSYIDRLIEGQHGCTYSEFDLMSKKLTVFEYDKEKFFNTEKSLGKFPFKKSLDVSYENEYSLSYSNNDALLFQESAKGLNSKIELDTIRVEITVSGDSFLRVGQCIDVNLPLWNKDQSKVGDTISGKFLITEIHHQIASNQYNQIMMIQKEAYEEL